MPIPCPRSPAARSAALALMLASSATRAQAADQVGGECTLEGKTIGFVDGVVYHRPYAFDETRQETVVALAEFVLDKTAIAAAEASQKDFEIFKQVRMGEKSARLELHILDGKVAELELNNSHTRLSPPPDPGVGTLRIAASDASHLGGNYSFDGDDYDDLRCSVSFDLTYATQ